MSNEMYYCSSCDKVFKLSGPGKKAKCPHCSTMLLDMGIVGEDYAKLDKQQKDALKIKTKSALNKKDTPSSEPKPAEKDEEKVQVSTDSPNNVKQTSLSDPVPDKDLYIDKQVSVPQESESSSDLDGNAILSSDSKAPSSPSTQRFSFFDSDEIKENPDTPTITNNVNNEKQTSKRKKRDENKQAKTGLKVLICIAAVLVLTIGGLTVYAFVINPSVLSLFRAEEEPESTETVVAEEPEEEPEVIEKDVIEEDSDVIEEEAKQDKTLSEGMAKAYLDAIKKYGQYYEKFALVYIDKSGKPQLSMLNEDYSLSLFSIDENDNLIDFGKTDIPDWENGVWGLGTYSRNLSFREKSGIIQITERGESGTGEWNTVYALENDRLVEVWNGGYDGLFDDNGDPIQDADGNIKNDEPTVNGQTVTMDEYNRELSKFTEGDGEPIPLSTDEGNYMPKEEMVSYLSSLINGNETTASYAQLYLDEIEKLYTSSQADQFALIYIDEDDIPELVATYSKGLSEDHQETVFLYSIFNNEIQLLYSGMVGMYGCSLYYSEKNNIVYSTGGAIDFNIGIDKIDKGQLVELLSLSINSDFDDSTGEVKGTYYLSEKEVSEQECIQRIAEYTSQCNPFTRVDNDCLHSVQFSNANIPVYAGEDELGTKPYMTYEEITNELRKLLPEGTKVSEPWKVAYKKYLSDIMSGKEGMIDYHEMIYVQGGRFDIFDITGDGIPELFVSPGQDPWSAYKYENGELVHLGEDYLVGYNPNKKELYYNDGSPWGGYYVYSIENGNVIYKYAFGEGDPEPPACPYYYEDSEHNFHDITKEKLDKYYAEMDLENNKITGIELTIENVDKELK